MSTPNGPAPVSIPAHVPPELVVDFDFLRDARMADDMFEGVLQLDADAPDLFYTPRNGGHRVAKGREVLFDIARNVDLFSSAAQTEDRKRQTVRIPIGLDPPEHTKYRQVLNQAFSPKAMAALIPSIRDLANQLIDAVVEDGKADFVPTISEPLPVLIFMRMAGLPEGRFAEFREWVLAAVASYDAAERQAVFDKVLAMTAPLVRERMETPGEDLISRIIQADIGGRNPTFDEVQSFYLMLFMAGLDTFVNGMSFGMRHLAVDQKLQARLRANPELIPDAMEELLRRYAFALPGRQVSRDDEYQGIQLKRGDSVMLFLPGANVDADYYEDPTAIVLGRPEAHIAFGAGFHRCAGSHLARIELKILYEEWLRRVPTFRLDPAESWTFHPALVLSVDSLPLVWG